MKIKQYSKLLKIMELIDSFESYASIIENVNGNSEKEIKARADVVKNIRKDNDKLRRSVLELV